MAKDSLPRIKDIAYMKSHNNIVFQYLLTEIRLCTLIILELNIYINQSLTICLSSDNSIIYGFNCITFIE